MKEVIIDRSRWRTGKFSKNSTGKGTTFLLNKEKYSCCLGFICRANKIGTSNKAVPWQCGAVKELSYFDKEKESYVNTKLANEAISINDNITTTYKEKEKCLKKLFKNSSYKLKFTGKVS